MRMIIGVLSAAMLPLLDCGSCTSDTDCDGYDTDVDCDDKNAAIHPGADEVCNGLDDNCDAVIDQSGALAVFPRRVLHTCQEEDTFLGLAALEAPALEPGDRIQVRFRMRAEHPAIEETVDCAADFTGCAQLEPADPAGYAPPPSTCTTGQCWSGPLYDDGVVVITLLNQTGSGTMSVVAAEGGTVQRATALVISHYVRMASGAASWPQIAVVGVDGFTRLNRMDDVLAPCFGTSHILPPSLPVAQPAGSEPQQALHPFLDAIEWRIDADGLPVLLATGGWYDGTERRMDVVWTLDMLPPGANGEVAFDVEADATVLAHVTLPAAAGFAGALGVGTLSSMYSDSDSFDADLLEAGEASVGAGSLVGTTGTTVDGVPLSIRAGDALWMRRTTKSDHNASASDEGLELRCAVWLPASGP